MWKNFHNDCPPCGSSWLFWGRKCNKRSALAEPFEQGTVLGTEFARETVGMQSTAFGRGCKALG